jgi:hypothetical protein
MDSTITVPAPVLRRRDYSDDSPTVCCGEPVKGKKHEPKYVEPEPGDPVDFHVRGTVKAVEAGMATVHVAFINDKRVERPAQKEDADNERGREAQQLRAAAEAADEGSEDY